MQVKLTGLVDPDKKIASIKCLRDHTGCNLRMAKDQVEAIGRGEVTVLNSVGTTLGDPLDTWFHVEYVAVNPEAATTAAILAARAGISASALSSIAEAVDSVDLREAARMIGKAYR